MWVNKKAKGILHQSLDRAMFMDIQACKTAQEIWNKLCLLYEGDEDIRNTNRIILLQNYYHFMPKSGESLHSIYKRFSNLILDLRNEDVEMRQSDINDHFLVYLPEKYGIQVASLNTSVTPPIPQT